VCPSIGLLDAGVLVAGGVSRVYGTWIVDILEALDVALVHA
jgi:hypothetical protein